VVVVVVVVLVLVVVVVVVVIVVVVGLVSLCLNPRVRACQSVRGVVEEEERDEGGGVVVVVVVVLLLVLDGWCKGDGKVEALIETTAFLSLEVDLHINDGGKVSS